MKSIRGVKGEPTILTQMKNGTWIAGFSECAGMFVVKVQREETLSC